MTCSVEVVKDPGFIIMTKCPEVQVGFKILIVICLGLTALYLSQVVYNGTYLSSFAYISQPGPNELPLPKPYNRPAVADLHTALRPSESEKPTFSPNFLETTLNHTLTSEEIQHAIDMTEFWRERAIKLDNKVQIIYNRLGNSFGIIKSIGKQCVF